MRLLFACILLLCVCPCFSQQTNGEGGTQNQNTETITTLSSEDSLVFDIHDAQDFNGYGTGGGYVTAKKGHKFIGLYVFVTNPTQTSASIDFKDVFLLDTVNKVKHSVHAVMGTGVFTSFKKKKQKLKPADDVNRKLVFVVPENAEAQILLYRQRIIPVYGGKK